MKVFITGLTGTLGTAIAKVHKARGDTVVGCARSEATAAVWLRNNPPGQLLIRSALSLDWRLLRGVDKLYHCAAMKHVDLCEVNIVEAVKQNIDLVHSIADACNDAGIQMVHISTDKACQSSSVYGASKLIAERIALRHGATVVRLGNLIGSSGSVFHLWKKRRELSLRIKLTDPAMTRFFISIQEAAKYVVEATEEFSYPPMKATVMGAVAEYLGVDSYDIVGLRPGETLHQSIVEGVSSEHAERWDIAELLLEARL